MIIVRLLSPEPVGWFWHHQLYSGVGADIVMESVTLKTPSMSAIACFRQLIQSGSIPAYEGRVLRLGNAGR
jgi:hypothetical protein